jgi:hypothetical protein
MHATKQWVLAVMTNHHECVHRNRSKEQLVPNCNIHTRLCMPCLHMSLSSDGRVCMWVDGCGKQRGRVVQVGDQGAPGNVTRATVFN